MPLEQKHPVLHCVTDSFPLPATGIGVASLPVVLEHACQGWQVPNTVGLTGVGEGQGHQDRDLFSSEEGVSSIGRSGHITVAVKPLRAPQRPKRNISNQFHKSPNSPRDLFYTNADQALSCRTQAAWTPARGLGQELRYMGVGDGGEEGLGSSSTVTSAALKTHFVGSARWADLQRPHLL